MANNSVSLLSVHYLPQITTRVFKAVERNDLGVLYENDDDSCYDSRRYSGGWLTC